MTSQHSLPPFRARCADEGDVPALPLADGSVSIGLTSPSGAGGVHDEGRAVPGARAVPMGWAQASSTSRGSTEGAGEVVWVLGAG